ncbi:MAG: indole-3-glycerol phosphate synthase TrpC [Phycisphaeraceae bacterium]|nr:indole-3-glycerol phosphate synthase TrpC [Phycisphaeraceae bacterium]
MADILAQIVADKREEVAQRKRQRPLETVRRAATATPPCRDFYGAVTQPAGQLRVIAEIKRASPSAGLIRPDFDPVSLAKAYRDAGAAAISCLTDEKYFQGSLAYLQAVRQAVDLPVLRKDFLVDSWQVYESRAAGADAVLLIAECLPGGELADVLDVALALGLAVLVEIHEEANLDRVGPMLESRKNQPVLLGINNRDLKRMVTDLDHTIRLAAKVFDRGRLVSESGIRTPEDVRRLREHGIDRILVGEHLMRQPDVAAALRHLMSA